MATTITAAIARSISHNEIGKVSLDDLLTAEEREQMNEAAAEWDRQAYQDHRRHVASTKVSEAQADHDGDSVLCGDNYDLVDMWGKTANGDEYRVHIRL